MAVAPAFIVWHYEEEFDSKVFAVALQAVVGSIRQLLNQQPPLLQSKPAQVLQALLLGCVL